MAIREGPNGKELLVMKHRNRLDLPKGHIETDETERECALREWTEETGVSASEVNIIDELIYKVSYQTRYKRFGGKTVLKTVVLFAAYVDPEIVIKPAEHEDSEWLLIDASISYQSKTIDEVMLF